MLGWGTDGRPQPTMHTQARQVRDGEQGAWAGGATDHSLG